MPEPAPIDLSKQGGVITVILAQHFELPKPYDTSPQVFPLLADDLPLMRDQLSEKIPPNTKIVLIGGNIPHGTYTVLQRVLDQRHLERVTRKNPAALSEAIRKVIYGNGKSDAPAPQLTATIAENAIAADGPVLVKTNGNGKAAPPAAQVRGAVTALCREADLGKGSAEEARRLFRVAQMRGISTTIPSLQQGITQLKRKGGRTETPKSIMTAQERALIVFDEAIAAGQKMIEGLTAVREYVANTEQTSVKIANKLREFQALAAMVQADTNDF